MGISMTLKECLASQHVPYEIIDHRRTGSTLESAEAAHIPGDQMVKTVLLGDRYSYLLAVIPATHRVDIPAVNKALNRDLELMGEDEVEMAFGDCEPGAVPPIGGIYGIDTVVDITLLGLPEVYFESGDHTELVHMGGQQFRELLVDAQVFSISQHL